ncbi:YheT family hydrolase [Planctomycetes bacterium K23_9]|uniref:Putative hydrolase n=1 Tax=Stieleria marina TaxID=1930275 RepID=A0A517NPF5_9BACT|nr:putative hydrolase [Planctomycetes bacterium K23_9]
MLPFDPPKFNSHALIRGGHLQTIFSVGRTEPAPPDSQEHRVVLPDGDSIVLQDNQAVNWRPGHASLLMIHGLSGCHGSPYMIRLANRFVKNGWRVFRMDMRGCGAAWSLASQLSHAGRSDDLVAGLAAAAQITQSGPMHAIGVSLGANQLLRAVGRIGSGIDREPDWFGRLNRIAAVVPPLNLLACSENMQRPSRRIYNHYFIAQLLARIPQQVSQRVDCQEILAGPRPRTLRELDDRMTAPLSGYASAVQYYQDASACHVVNDNPVKTLVVAADDDPIVPITCFTESEVPFSPSTQLLISRGGGHNGFIGPRKVSWLDGLMQQWFVGR